MYTWKRALVWRFLIRRAPPLQLNNNDGWGLELIRTHTFICSLFWCETVYYAARKSYIQRSSSVAAAAVMMILEICQLVWYWRGRSSGETGPSFGNPFCPTEAARAPFFLFLFFAPLSAALEYTSYSERQGARPSKKWTPRAAVFSFLQDKNLMMPRNLYFMDVEGYMEI